MPPPPDRGAGVERRHVFVTGASRGIGRATALAFAREGARVAINYVGDQAHPGDEAAAEETATLVEDAGGEPFLVRADLGVGDEVARMVREVLGALSHVDVLVLNAGICPFRPFFELDEALWDRTHDVNLKGAFLTAQAVARSMVDRGTGGRIIATSSISALVGGSNQVHYCPTKAGLSAMIRSLAIVLGPHQITCNAVLPGSIETDINRADFAQPGKRAYLEGRVPLRRLGEPRDVGDVIWLMSQEGMRYVNGAELVVDGGLLVNLE